MTARRRKAESTKPEPAAAPPAVGDAISFVPPGRPRSTDPELWRAHASRRGIVRHILTRGKRRGWLVVELAEHPLVVANRGGRPRRWTIDPEDVLQVEIRAYDDWRRDRGETSSSPSPRPQPAQTSPKPTASRPPGGRLGLALEALAQEEDLEEE